jgi:hypothetical protein
MATRAVYKSLAVEQLDHHLSGESDLRPLYSSALGRLDRTDASELVGAARVLEDSNALPPDSTQEFLEYWLSDGSPFGEDLARIMRLGYQEAIRVANEDVGGPLPIETFWVTGASDQFEVHICEGSGHITVLLFFPFDRDYGSKRATARSWVVRVGTPREGEGAEQLSDPQVIRLQVSGPRS